MTTQKIFLTIDVPEGFILTGEHRPVKRGEKYLTPLNEVEEYGGIETSSGSYLILRTGRQMSASTVLKPPE